MAVTREGIPVRCWVWPGGTADSALIGQVKDDMREWSLARVVWVVDRGFTSAANRRRSTGPRRRDAPACESSSNDGVSNPIVQPHVTLIVLAVWPAMTRPVVRCSIPGVDPGLVTSQALTQLWALRWAECPPFAHWLRSHYPDRWVRSHSLPGTKRYASNDTEYDTILDRHYTVMSELGPGPEIVVITSEWTPTPAVTPHRAPPDATSKRENAGRTPPHSRHHP